MKRMLVVWMTAGLVLTGAGGSGATAVEGRTYDVIVVGAGGGGLAAAARAAQSGLKVLLVEQHDKVGGYMTAFARGDYTFEVDSEGASVEPWGPAGSSSSPRMHRGRKGLA